MNIRIKKILIIAAPLLTAVFIMIFTVPDRSGSLKTTLKGYETVLSIHTVEDGIPGNDTNQILIKSGFWLSYNEEYEQANWTAYILTKQDVMSGEASRSNDFRADTAVAGFSAQPSDYRGSGYDRGHLVPAADMKSSPAAMSESFLLSNISPQDPGFNRGIWRTLEEQTRDWAVQNDSLYIITGPVLNSIRNFIGENQVGVPSHYFKIIVDISYPTYKAIGFLIENRPDQDDFYKFVVTIDSIESLTGFNFFSNQENTSIKSLESRSDLQEW